MKKLCLIFLVFASVLLSSCTTVPTSVEAKEKMESLGYTVELFTKYGDEVANQGITQVTVLRATKDKEFLDAYFFANEEDTDTFYSGRSKSLSADVEVLKKNRYSIYRGTQNAVDDFLS